ncbi:ATP synthase protein I [Candidatus Filomicrobium marinum]|uniref:ATP synthase protein I n=2 Tax=Filomicrobium TaxID=119044 RepID=A0A0D6JKE4_9HYPH|nr:MULTISPECIES: AtpZ/AtpI family protein [Filomicrobium]MCV0369134.1 AtpZ/AtpI family protein [Filomicrobium sp.]CFX60806.1 ATP synthase protein I [Candidatus Filomicrobium marinum]CPR22433.1 ATP synthase protein I [Candidatus Filomicrobium marinum]SDO84764.1 ATP synthase protein I [Filomicrobium insigne]
MTNGSKGDAPENGAPDPREKEALERRLEGLGQRLDKIRSEEAAKAEAEEDARIHSRGMAYGLRMASELVGAVLVGGLIGFGLDTLLGTVPWFFLFFFVLGLIAGIRNVIRGFERLQAEIAAKTRGDIGTDIRNSDDDD